MKYDLFISYATSDGLESAKAVADHLTKKYFLSVFFASEALRSGELIDTKVKDAIRSSDRVLLLFTPDGTKSPWVQGEAAFAGDIGKTLLLSRRADVENNELPVRFMQLDQLVFEDTQHLVKLVDENGRWGIPVIIPAAGRSGGLYPMNLGMPKILLPIGDRPILHHIVEKLDPKVFSQIIILTDMFSDMIEYSAGLTSTTIGIQCKQTPNPRRLPLALKELGIETTFLLHYSDILVEGDFSWKDLVEHHKYYRNVHHVIGTLMASNRYRIPVGRIQTGSQQLITDFVEKPDSFESVGYTINMAVSIFEPEFLTYINEDDESLYGDSLKTAMKAKKRFCSYEYDSWRHIQTLGDWYEAQKHYVPRDEDSFLKEVTSRD